MLEIVKQESKNKEEALNKCLEQLNVSSTEVYYYFEETEGGLFKGKKYIEVEFCDDNPLSKKYVRFNQSGTVCYCLEGNHQGKQKVKKPQTEATSTKRAREQTSDGNSKRKRRRYKKNNIENGN